MFLLRQQFKGDERDEVKRWAVSHLVLKATAVSFTQGTFLGTGVVFLSVILSLASRIGIYIPPHTQ